MKKILISIFAVLFCLAGCSASDFTRDTTPVPSDRYSVGQLVTWGDVKFNIYKIDDKNDEVYLLAHESIAKTAFSASNRESESRHNYRGSLIEKHVNKFVHDLEDKGYIIKSSGIIKKDDLIDLGFTTAGLNGTSYKTEGAPGFVRDAGSFWVDGYCKYNSYAWVYLDGGTLTTERCEEEFGVRPVIVVSSSEIEKQPLVIDPSLTIEAIISSGSTWIMEGGLHNPYDRYYFDCENMMFINEFESSELTRSSQFEMEFIDKHTMLINGVTEWYGIPARLTVINENKLRLRFIDDEYNRGDYFLIRSELPDQVDSTIEITVPATIPTTEPQGETTPIVVPATDPVTEPTTEPTEPEETEPEETEPEETEPEETEPEETEPKETEPEETEPEVTEPEETEPEETEPEETEPEETKPEDGYVDPRVSVWMTDDGWTVYEYARIRVLDTRTWGATPSISITANDGLNVSFYNRDDAKVIISLSPNTEYITLCSILDNGSYKISYVGDFHD